MRSLLKILLYDFASLGCAALALTAMLASPLPPPLASLRASAQKIDPSGKPDLTQFQARDGTWLAYRLYPAVSAGDRVAILSHGSSALSESLPVIAYANDPGSQKLLTSVYSYRLLAVFGPDLNWGKTEAAIRAAAAKTVVLCGADDDLMDAAAFESKLRPLGVAVTILPKIDHVGIVHDPAALSALVDAIRENGA